MVENNKIDKLFTFCVKSSIMSFCHFNLLRVKYIIVNIDKQYFHDFDMNTSLSVN